MPPDGSHVRVGMSASGTPPWVSTGDGMVTSPTAAVVGTSVVPSSGRWVVHASTIGCCGECFKVKDL